MIVYALKYIATILQHRNFIHDKVVVDVGCGIGILSVFFALAGGRKVYALMWIHV